MIVILLVLGLLRDVVQGILMVFECLIMFVLVTAFW